MKGKVTVEVVGPPTHQATISKMMRKKGYKTLASSPLRVLTCILELAQDGKPITIRAIARHLKWKATNWVYLICQRLKEEGLINFDETAKATIWPKCRMELVNPEFESAVAQSVTEATKTKKDASQSEKKVNKK